MKLTYIREGTMRTWWKWWDRWHLGRYFEVYKWWAVGYATAFLVTSCGWITPTPATVDPSATCAEAEARLKDLGCDDQLIVPGPDETAATSDDIPWGVYCRRVQDSGIMAISTGCIAAAVDCAAAEGCQ